MDSSADELSANTTATSTVVADVSRHIPFENGEVDLLVSRTLLEHVPDLQSAVTEMARVLKPGGRSIHLLPCRYALFAIAARVVPFDIAKAILHRTIPESEGVVEFDVVYDRGHPTALEAAFARAHFHEVNVECTWDQTDYFQPFVPAFLLVLAYQRFAEAFRIRIVAAYALVEAVR